MRRTDILIVGGGAAGLMAACRTASSGCSVILVEKGPVPGRKILITGKGRCNITNMAPWEEFQTHIHPDSGFLKNSFFAFSNEKVRSFFESGGLPVKVERGNRLFPESDKSVSVRDFLWKKAKESGVRILTESDVVNVSRVGRSFVSDVRVDDGGALSMEQIISGTVILATGGKSYPYTGSTGAGYEIAASLGHTIKSTFPSLTAVMPLQYNPDLIGSHLKNVSLSLMIDGDCVDTREGELDFTNNGIEGSLGFQLSRRAVAALRKGQKVTMVVDLKPALDVSTLTDRVSRESYGKNIIMKKFLQGYLPKEIIGPFMASNPDLSLRNLPVRLKKWVFRIYTYKGYERCVVTAGGVSLDEISRKDMGSKLVPGLFFAGEVIDLDADTGGYNLQIAFSTGSAAAAGAVAYVSKNRDLGQQRPSDK